MIVSFHLIAFLVNEYFTPEWQKEVRYITREVVAAMSEVDKNTAGEILQIGKCVSQYANCFCQVWRHPLRENAFPNPQKIVFGLTSSISGNAFPKL